jgi:hypothetical protein
MPSTCTKLLYHIVFRRAGRWGGRWGRRCAGGAPARHRVAVPSEPASAFIPAKAAPGLERHAVAPARGRLDGRGTGERKGAVGPVQSIRTGSVTYRHTLDPRLRGDDGVGAGMTAWGRG